MSIAKQGAKTAVPRLRFPEFRKAAAWETKPLSALLDYERPEKYIVANATYQNSGTPVLTANKSFILGYTPEVDGVYTGVPVVIFDDFTTDTKYVDFPFKVKSSAIKILKVKGDDSLKVIFELMGGIKFEPKEHKRYYISEYQNLKIAIPEPSEQQKIADCLTSLDEVIAAQGRKVEALKAHKRGLMQQLFPREGETRPRLRFPEFRDGPEWEVERLAYYVASLDAGVSVNSGDRPACGDQIGVLKTSCVANGVFDSHENKVVQDSSEIERVKEPVRANTILISRMNTIALVGANAFVEKDAPNLFLPDRLWAAKVTPKGHARFLAYVLGSERGRAALSGLASGSSGTMKNIGKAEVLALQIYAPSLPEQQRIADCLSSLDTQITAETNQLTALKTHKQGLMQQLFLAPEVS